MKNPASETTAFMLEFGEEIIKIQDREIEIAKLENQLNILNFREDELQDSIDKELIILHIKINELTMCLNDLQNKRKGNTLNKLVREKTQKKIKNGEIRL